MSKDAGVSHGGNARFEMKMNCVYSTPHLDKVKQEMGE